MAAAGLCLRTRPGSIAHVASILSLVEASVGLARLQREERHRTSLWPVEEGLMLEGNLFVAPRMREIHSMARRVGPSDLPVLITGETGSGKEIIAREVHDVIAARQQELRRARLLRRAARHAGQPPVRAPQGRVHRRHRQLPGGDSRQRRRDALPRRDRRGQPRPAGEAPPLPRDGRGASARRDEARQGRRAGHRGDEPAPRSPDQGKGGFARTCSIG